MTGTRSGSKRNKSSSNANQQQKRKKKGKEATPAPTTNNATTPASTTNNATTPAPTTNNATTTQVNPMYSLHSNLIETIAQEVTDDYNDISLEDDVEREATHKLMIRTALLCCHPINIVTKSILQYVQHCFDYNNVNMRNLAFMQIYKDNIMGSIDFGFVRSEAFFNKLKVYFLDNKTKKIKTEALALYSTYLQVITSDITIKQSRTGECSLEDYINQNNNLSVFPVVKSKLERNLYGGIKRKRSKGIWTEPSDCNDDKLWSVHDELIKTYILK